MLFMIIYLSMAVQLRKWSILNTLVLFSATVSNGMNTVLISTYSKLRSRFYAFSKFRHFKPSILQQEHFIKTLIFPILAYNIELWYFSSNANDRARLLKLFNRNRFAINMDNFVAQRIYKLATDFIKFNDHILNH